jgi:hypothetical protein
MYGFSLPLWYQYKLLQNTKYNHHSCTVSVPLRLKLRRRILFYGGGGPFTVGNCLASLAFLLLQTFQCFAFQSFDFERH